MGVLREAGLMALASMFIGVVPLTLGVLYALWPGEQRLALVRTLSLATVFAAIAGTALGFINVARGIGVRQWTDVTRVAAIGIAESLVPLLVGFGCLTITWLCVSIGLWRRP